MQDYYKILGVEKKASQDDIKKAYRKLAHKYHPDKEEGDSGKFKEINEAYQILSDESKRKQYDQFGRVYGSGPGAGGPGNGTWAWDFDTSGIDDLGDLSEIFNSFFEGMGVRQKRRTYNRGRDLEFSIEITLEEAQKGRVIDLDYETLVNCQTCDGRGHPENVDMKECDYCNGRGEVQESRDTFFGNFARVATCKACRGLGKTPEKSCSTCKGEGRIRGQKAVNVEIRSGVMNEQIIKVKGMGEAGEHKSEPGDLYVRIKIKPHAVFQRHGNDLHRSVSVGILDVLKAGEIQIGTLSGGSAKVKIPTGFNLNDEIKIKGEGMTKSGNLIVKLDIKTPKKLSSKAKKLVDKLKEELDKK